MSIKISFIVPCLNHLAHTQQMYRSLKETLPLESKYEVIFVDDASVDGTCAWLAGLTEPNVKVIFNQTTGGYAKANNKALAVARGHVIGFLNNDLIFKKNWLEPMLELLESPQLKAGIIGNVQVRLADGEVDHLGIHFNLQAKFEHLRQPLLNGDKKYLRTFALTGACCVIKKDTLMRVQGFSEEFLNGCEDVDLCLKIAQLGLYSYVALNSTIGHHVSLTRGVNSLQNETNSSILQKKWRIALKRELGTNWYTALTDQTVTAVERHFDGELVPEIRQMPMATSTLIAENMLLRNEFEWARLLKQMDLNEDDDIQITCTGLSAELNSEYFVASEVIRMSAKGLKNVRNFCAFGYRVENASQSECFITVTVNNIHRKTFDITNDRLFSLNIENPLLLPDGDNSFKLVIERTPRETEGKTEVAPAWPVLFTHFMLDKRFVYIPELSNA